MAEPYYVAVSPHNYNSTSIGLAATVQAAATMPNFIITEYFVNFATTSALISGNTLTPENGISIFQIGPGSGWTWMSRPSASTRTGSIRDAHFPGSTRSYRVFQGQPAIDSDAARQAIEDRSG